MEHRVIVYTYSKCIYIYIIYNIYICIHGMIGKVEYSVDEKVITADHCKLKKSIMVSKCQLSM